MATRAEQFHADEQKSGERKAKPTTPKRPKKAKRRKVAERTARKATYALEAPRPGRPSRKSTRKAANRAKPDTNLNLREERAKGSPESKYSKTRARAARPRGSK